MMNRQNPQMDSPAPAASGGFDQTDGGPRQYGRRARQHQASTSRVTGSSRSQSGPTPGSQGIENYLTGILERPSQPRQYHTDIQRIQGKQARQMQSGRPSFMEGSGGKPSPGEHGYHSDDYDTTDGAPAAMPYLSKSRDAHDFLHQTDTSGYSSGEPPRKSDRKSRPGSSHHLEGTATKRPPADAASVYHEDDNTGDECGLLPLNQPLSRLALADGGSDDVTGHIQGMVSSNQRGPDLSGMAVSQPPETISADAIALVARHLHSLEACVALAAELNFSRTDLLQIKMFDGMQAHRILQKWCLREAENATGQVLYDALCSIGHKGVANECKDILLRNGMQLLQQIEDQSQRIGNRHKAKINHHPPTTSSTSAVATSSQFVNPVGDDCLQPRPANSLGGYHALFDPPLEPKHTCSVCNKALREPMQTECGHRFCKVCMEPLLKSSQTSSSGPVTCPVSTCQEPLTEVYPDNFCRREVLSLHVKCSNTEGGCHWTGQLLDLEAHLKTCQHGLLPCPHRQCGCKEMLQQADVEKHAQERCQFRNYVCPYCGEILVFFAIQKHIDEDCQEYAQPCPAGCEQTVKRSDLQDHLWKYCSMVDRCCPLANLGCQVKGKQPELMQHMHNQDALYDHMGLVGQHLLNSSNQLKPVMQTVENQGVHLADVEKSLEAEREAHKQTRTRLMATEERLKDFENKLAAFQARLDERPVHQATASRPDDQLAAFESRLAATERKVVQAEATAKTAKENVETNRLKMAGIERQVSSFNQIITRTDAIMAEFDLRLLSQETSSFNGTLIWKIPDFSRHFEEARSGHKPSLYSPPFYTSRHGYKVCARVYLNGDGSGKNTHMSIFFVVMRGEFDALLQWPFRQKVTLTLLDQMQGRSNVSDTFQPDPRSSSFQRPISEMNIASGCPKFVPHETLRSSNHLRNNTIFIRVAVDTTGLPNY